MKYLNTTRTIPVILFVTLTLLVGGLSGCAGGDMATVTISIGNHGTPVSQMTPLLDRILAFFTFAREANAQPAPWSFELTITGAGMIPITRTVPDDTMTLTLDIPSGPARVFTAVAYLGSTRTYGGIVTRDLALGENATIPIQMDDLPVTPSGLNPVRTSNQQGVPFNYVSWNGGDLSTVTGYYVYRSSSETGNYTRIAIVPNPGPAASAYIEDYSINEQFNYWYKVSGYNAFGEGDTTSPLPDNL